MSENLSHDSTLTRLAKRINEREEIINQSKNKTVESARIAITEVILQGQDLIAAKARIPHGLWVDWLKAHCPKSVCMAQRYMRAAERCGDKELDEGNSLRALLSLSFVDEVQSEKPTKQWPPFYEAYCRINKVMRFVEKHPADKWPDEIRDKARGDLLPLLRVLWPDKFT